MEDFIKGYCKQCIVNIVNNECIPLGCHLGEVKQVCVDHQILKQYKSISSAWVWKYICRVYTKIFSSFLDRVSHLYREFLTYRTSFYWTQRMMVKGQVEMSESEALSHGRTV